MATLANEHIPIVIIIIILIQMQSWGLHCPWFSILTESPKPIVQGKPMCTFLCSPATLAKPLQRPSPHDSRGFWGLCGAQISVGTSWQCWVNSRGVPEIRRPASFPRPSLLWVCWEHVTQNNEVLPWFANHHSCPFWRSEGQRPPKAATDVVLR